MKVRVLAVSPAVDFFLYSILSYLPKPWTISPTVLLPTVLPVQRCVWKLHTVNYGIYGLQVNRSSKVWMDPSPQPAFYIMIVQRNSAISCGTAVGESPHSEGGS
jgi:hypothetical protein